MQEGQRVKWDWWQSFPHENTCIQLPWKAKDGLPTEQVFSLKWLCLLRSGKQLDHSNITLHSVAPSKALNASCEGQIPERVTQGKCIIRAAWAFSLVQCSVKPASVGAGGWAVKPESWLCLMPLVTSDMWRFIMRWSWPGWAVATRLAPERLQAQAAVACIPVTAGLGALHT